MKRLLLALTAVLLLTGCGQKVSEGLRIRQKLRAAPGCRFSCTVTAEYEDKAASFSMDCTADADGQVQFTVTAPETIAGITGTVSGEGGTLTFDETVLALPLLADGTLAPVRGPWVMLHSLTGGYLVSEVREGETLHLSVNDSYRDDALGLELWLDGTDAPVRCEIACSGRRVMTMEVANFACLS